LPCMVGMDTQPVRTALVNTPELYPWSSHAHYIGLRHDRALSVPPAYWALGNTPFAREAAYAALVRQGVGETLWRRITEAAAQGWALGGQAFLDALGQLTPRRLSKGKAGRPRGRPAKPSGQETI
jgi:putative transposase